MNRFDDGYEWKDNSLNGQKKTNKNYGLAIVLTLGGVIVFSVRLARRPKQI